MKTIQSKTVVFITGAFVSHQGWKQWEDYFTAQGYAVHAPSWPHKEGAPADLRNLRPNDTALAKLTLSRLIDHYAAFIQQLPEKPILIGHSLGGLITQVLVHRGLAAGAVMIHSVPPLGVIPYEFNFLKSTWKALGLFTNLDKTYMMSFKDWQFAFTNGMSLEDQRKAYEENTIPESKRVARGGLTLAARVNFSKPHVPMLFIAGGEDQIIPASLNYRNFKSYKDKNSITEYKRFEGINHFVVSLPSWKTQADYVLNWLKK